MGEESRFATDRASRSRSRTPFLRSSCDRELCNNASGAHHSHQVQIKYQKSLAVLGESHDGQKKHTIAFEYTDSAFGTASVTGDVKAIRKRRDKGGKGTLAPVESLRPINGLYRNSKEQDITSAAQKTVSRSVSKNKTSDYSSEEGETLVQEDRSAFLIYKKSGDWWNVFPKTDYTYSEYSPHRKEIAPGVVNMPNMSRRGLHCQDFTSLTHDSSLHNRLKVSSNHERTRISSSYAKSGGDVSDQKWARVLGVEYASKESARVDRVTAVESHVWTKIVCFLLSLLHSFTSSVTRSMRSIHSGVLFLGSRGSDSSTLSVREMLLQWIYQVLGYVKILDTWLLLGWNADNDSVHTSIKDTYYQRWWAKLLKVFLLFLPTLLVAGCWAYVQIRDDQEVSNSVYIPQPNEPMLTSQSKSASGTVIQDFGSFSPLKFMTSSLAANFYMLWMWILYPWTKNQESENKVGVQNVITPVSVISLAENLNSKVKECALPKVDMDDLVSKIVINPVFVSLLSSVKDEGASSSVKIDSILAKMNLLQQQLDQKSIEIETIKELIKKEVSIQFDSFSERKGIDDDDAVILETLRKLAFRIDEISSQNKILENMINIESSTREKSLLSLIESLEKLNEQYSQKPSVTVSNELHNHESFNQFRFEMMKYVEDQLVKYDADKTGIPDYALESSGGSIVSTRCTETYQAKTAVFSLFGIPLWSPSINPRKIIQPGILPGECWAFKGSQGYVVIKLSKKVHITKFSLEHTPKSLSPVGTIDSAPRNFSVWGLNSEVDTGQIFGRYIYDQNGPSLQYFPVERHDLPPYEFIELRIESNHGNLEYTCVYRFRVHGNVHTKENELFGQHGN